MANFCCDQISLGIELGSTRIKCCLITENGELLATGIYEWENRFEDGYWTYSLDEAIKGVGECHAVGKLALAFLELLHSGLGICAVVPIGLAAGKAQDVEAVLQLAHIRAVEVGKSQVQGAVAHAIALVDQRRPRLCVNLRTQGQPVVKPKACNGRCGGSAKHLAKLLRFAGLVAKLCKTLLNVLNCGASCAFSDGVHILSRSRRLGLTETLHKEVCHRFEYDKRLLVKLGTF